MSTLPSFEYHPDPISTGMIVASQSECVCCGERRGFIYVGPVYAVEEYQDQFCPWCIADGSASRTFDAIFTDEIGIGGGGAWESVPDEVVTEVACRTPGFSGWQQEQWWTHCGDAAAFLGRAGQAELAAAGDEAVQAIQDHCGLEGPQWTGFFNTLDKDGSPTAYFSGAGIAARWEGIRTATETVPERGHACRQTPVSRQGSQGRMIATDNVPMLMRQTLSD